MIERLEALVRYWQSDIEELKRMQRTKFNDWPDDFYAGRIRSWEVAIRDLGIVINSIKYNAILEEEDHDTP